MKVLTPAVRNRCLVFISDAAAVVLSYWIAFQLRFDFNLPVQQSAHFFNTLGIVLVLRLVAFYYFDLYRGMWRYASMDDLKSIFKAVASSQVVISAVILFLNHADFSRAVVIIDPILVVLFIGGVRFAIRATREMRSQGNIKELPKVLIFGAGDLGESVLREIKREKPARYHVVGFLDDDRGKWHRRIHGKPIFGGRNSLGKIAAKY